MPGTTLGVKRKRSYAKATKAKRPRLERPVTISSQVATVPRTLNIMGFKTKRLKMLYSDSSFQLDVPITTGSAGVTVFRMNSVFDPDYTYTGHQPRGFDQMALLFGKYVVHACKVEMWFTPYISGDKNYVVGITLHDEVLSAAALDIDSIMEMPNTVVSKDVFAMGNVNNSPSISTYCDLAKWNNRKHEDLIKEDSLIATVTSNPTDVVYAHCWAQSCNGAPVSQPIVVRAMVRLTYDVEFFEPKQPLAS